MSDYKRLTKEKWTNENCKPVYDKNDDIVMDIELFDLLMTEHNRLAELEDKIEQGTLIELPCKVGDTVWEVSPFSKMPTAITAPNIHTILRWKEDEAFGSELFLTYEEAEKRLLELQGGKE